MRPYLAQGAGRALEDANQLGQSLTLPGLTMAARLNRYAQARWHRNAQVQRRSVRNGVIFHARGPLRWARNLALGVLGERLIDLPWLYGGGASGGPARSL
jgi:salicylate hydroxylase